MMVPSSTRVASGATCDSSGSMKGIPRPWCTVRMKGSSFCTRSANASGASAKNLQTTAYCQLAAFAAATHS